MAHGKSLEMRAIDTLRAIRRMTGAMVVHEPKTRQQIRHAGFSRDRRLAAERQFADFLRYISAPPGLRQVPAPHVPVPPADGGVGDRALRVRKVRPGREGDRLVSAWQAVVAFPLGVVVGFLIGSYVGYGKGWKDSGDQIEEER